MSELKHTPGPWMTDDETWPIIIQRNSGLEVATIYGDGREQRAANARLIAAAPEQNAELIEEHRWLCKLAEKFDFDKASKLGIYTRQEAVSAAIAKAEGKP
jgi:hypothetical protein